MATGIIQSHSLAYNLAELQKLNIKTFTGTRTAFLTLWHDKLREMNVTGDPEDWLSYVASQSLLKTAIQSDPHLLLVFDEYHHTGNKRRDFETISRNLNNRAINKDNADADSKTIPSSLVVNSHLTSSERDELEAYRAHFDETLSIPKHIYSKLSKDFKIALRKASDDDRRTLVSGMTSDNTSQSSHQKIMGYCDS